MVASSTEPRIAAKRQLPWQNNFCGFLGGGDNFVTVHVSFEGSVHLGQLQNGVWGLLLLSSAVLTGFWARLGRTQQALLDLGNAFWCYF